jgi:hypothetical protein
LLAFSFPTIWGFIDIGDITYIIHGDSSQDIFVDFIASRSYIIFMTTNKPRVLITMENRLLERIDDYRYDKRIPSRSEAIRKLLNEALTKYEKEESNK